MTIESNTIFEFESLKSSCVHSMWGMTTVKAPDVVSYNKNIDFVVCVDHSGSMKNNNKLAFVVATIEYFVRRLDDEHKFALIIFNHKATVMTELLNMTKENKQIVINILQTIVPSGSTNLSGVLFKAIDMIRAQNIIYEQQSINRISSVLLFTDGLANAGLKGWQLVEHLQQIEVSSGVTINTFGYGPDHDSRVLKEIAFCSKGGVYYFVNDVESIPSTFGECLGGLLSTVAHNIKIRIQGQDGCRLVKFLTKFPIVENIPAKDYEVSLGTLFSQESRSLVFKVSLRKMDQPLPKHSLVRIIVTSTNTQTGIMSSSENLVSVARPDQDVCGQIIPVELDKHINRYTAAYAIEEAQRRADTANFELAQNKLSEAMVSVQNSISGGDSYCKDLLKDMKQCLDGMANSVAYLSVMHYVNSYSSMYFNERSTGSVYFFHDKDQRSSSYGYQTVLQKEQASCAKDEVLRNFHPSRETLVN